MNVHSMNNERFLHSLSREFLAIIISHVYVFFFLALVVIAAVNAVIVANSRAQPAYFVGL